MRECLQSFEWSMLPVIICIDLTQPVEEVRSKYLSFQRKRQILFKKKKKKLCLKVSWTHPHNAFGQRVFLKYILQNNISQDA